MTGINSNLKFSYNLIRGSVEKRQEFVSKTNEKMFEVLFPALKDDCSFSKFKKIYAKTIPEQKEVDVIPFKNDDIHNFCAAQDYKYEENNLITGLTLEIPIQEPKNFIKKILNKIFKQKFMEISKDEILSLMHENTHLLDTLANPKQTGLTQRLSIGNKYSTKRDKWYDKTLYNQEGKSAESIKPRKVLGRVKKETREFLKGKSIEDQIAHLQDTRYQLEQERHAYAEEVKYAKILQKKGVKVDESELQDMDKLYLFTEKINFLKRMISDLIAKERRRLAREHQN